MHADSESDTVCYQETKMNEILSPSIEVFNPVRNKQPNKTNILRLLFGSFLTLSMWSFIFCSTASLDAW